MADPAPVLDELAAELRRAVDDAASTVPSVTSRDWTGDSAVACRVGGDDDGSKQWNYAVRLSFDADSTEVVAAARTRLEARGFLIRERPASGSEVGWTALKEGASISVRAGSDPSLGSAVSMVGVTACVFVDGSVDTTNPA